MYNMQRSLSNTICVFSPTSDVNDTLCHNDQRHGPLVMSHARLRLTHWGRVTQIYVSKITIIGSYNGWQSLQIAPSRVYPKKSTTRPIWLNGLYYNLTHPINLMRVVLDWIYTSWKEALRFSIMLYLCLYIYYGNSPVCMPNKHCFNVETGLIP